MVISLDSRGTAAYTTSALRWPLRTIWRVFCGNCGFVTRAWAPQALASICGREAHTGTPRDNRLGVCTHELENDLAQGGAWWPPAPSRKDVSVPVAWREEAAAPSGWFGSSTATGARDHCEPLRGPHGPSPAPTLLSWGLQVALAVHRRSPVQLTGKRKLRPGEGEERPPGASSSSQASARDRAQLQEAGSPEAMEPHLQGKVGCTTWHLCPGQNRRAELSWADTDTARPSLRYGRAL